MLYKSGSIVSLSVRGIALHDKAHCPYMREQHEINNPQFAHRSQMHLASESSVCSLAYKASLCVMMLLYALLAQYTIVLNACGVCFILCLLVLLQPTARIILPGK